MSGTDKVAPALSIHELPLLCLLDVIKREQTWSKDFSCFTTEFIKMVFLDAGTGRQMGTYGNYAHADLPPLSVTDHTIIRWANQTAAKHGNKTTRTHTQSLSSSRSCSQLIQCRQPLNALYRWRGFCASWTSVCLRSWPLRATNNSLLPPPPPRGNKQLSLSLSRSLARSMLAWLCVGAERCNVAWGESTEDAAV